MSDQPPLFFEKRPTPERLRQLLRYEPETGELFWLRRGLTGWDTRYAGTRAFTAKTAAGYRHGIVENTPQKAHRIAWAIHHGSWPNEIDHINGDKADNRIANLRVVTRQQNSCNRGLRADNRSGALGVRRQRSGWQARIYVNGQSKCLGTFRSLEEAVEARQRASAEAGFHPNHGRNP
jgi:hypothetical protein